MNKSRLRATVGFVLLSLFVLTTVCSAQERVQDPACSPVNAAGQYGFSDSGTIIGVGSRVAVGLLTFDAAGKIGGTVTATLNGIPGTTTLSGTYTVDASCIGTASFTEFAEGANNQAAQVLTATVAIVWDNNMREARFIFTSVALPDGTPLSTAVSGIARKLALSSGDDCCRQ